MTTYISSTFFKYLTHPGKLILVLWVILFCVAPSVSWLCPQSARDCVDECEEEPICANDRTALNSYDCCHICVKGKNETCGGRNNALGICENKLTCILSSVEDGHYFTGVEKGTCQDPKTYCKELIKYQGYIIVESRCVCMIVDSCSKVSFPYTKYDECKFALVNEQSKNISQKFPNCSNVVCQADEVECPSDSYKVPLNKPTDPCCSAPQQCVCLPKTCEAVTCPTGMQATIVQHGDGKPGSCCDIYSCVNDTELMCSFNKKHYKNGEEWQFEKCSRCVCHDGLTFCQTVKCSSTSDCGRMIIPEGECCPVCIGCVSPSGHLYNSSDIWKEDDCTTCTCANGQAQCQAEMCRTNCLHPRKIPGQCCPICEDDKECLALENCTLSCSSMGYLKDRFGCDVCKCREIDNCDLICSNGYKKNETGQVICECINSTTTKCPSMEKCKKDCIHGFKVDKDGCERCKCIKCQKNGDCDKKCLGGYAVDDHGCPLCMCNEVKVTSLSDKPSDVQSTKCISGAGDSYSDGTVWYDGCHLCACKGGQILCSMITCPSLHCDRPQKVQGQCCPSCPGDLHRTSVPNSTVCQTFDSHYHQEGETWQLDSCSKCACIRGQVLCSAPQCPPILCSYPNYLPGSCCPYCSASNGPTSSSSSSLVPCKSSDGSLHANGEAWRTGPCESCFCHEGVVRCYQQKCPNTKCNQLLHLKNRCCPICLDISLPQSKCEHKNVLYGSGEVWKVGDCTHCVCISGHKFCTEQTCQHTCQNPLKIQGQCCPICTDHPEKSSGLSGIIAILVIICIILAVLLVAVGLLVIFILRHRNSSKLFFPHSLSWKPKNSVSLKCPAKSTQLDYRASFYEYADSNVKPVAL